MRNNSDPSMKSIWFRAGMKTKLSSSEYKELIKADEEGNVKKVEDLFRTMIKRGEISGESYIVGKNNGGFEEFDNPEEEISVVF